MLDRQRGEISTEELLKALNDSTEGQETPDDAGGDIFSFIDAFNIKSGNHIVSVDLLFQLYKQWNKGEKLSRNIFNLKMYSYFGSDKNRNSTLKLNKEIKELLNIIKEYTNSSENRFKKINLTNKNYRNYFQKFLTECHVKPGSLYIESDILYYIYDTWCYKNKKSTLSYLRFTKMCGLFLQYKKFNDSDVKWFAVDESIKQSIDVEAVLNWRRGRERRGAAKKYSIKKEDRKEIIYPEAKTKQEAEE